jgi:hypothetical protein
MTKTKEELLAEHDTAVAEARIQYDRVVIPARERYKTAEQQARVMLEEATRYVAEQYKKITDISEDEYRARLADLKSQYNQVATPARTQRDDAVKRAGEVYSEAVGKLWKGPDYGSQKYHDPIHIKLFGYENVTSTTNEPDRPTNPIKETQIEIPTSTGNAMNCHFCGGSEARTKAGLNKVKYRLKLPNATFWARLFRRDWKYACQDCADYMAHLWGPVTMKQLEEKL